LVLLLTCRIVFFVDQCLAGTAIPQALTNSSGYPSQRHVDNFDIRAKDEFWLPKVGARGWILVTKDWRIQQRPILREAIMNANVRAFVFREQRLSLGVMVAILNLAMPKMLNAINRYEAPFIFAVEMNGEITPISALNEIQPLVNH
jgi:hypothetical protein